jgi:subtilisin family serine protease
VGRTGEKVTWWVRLIMGQNILKHVLAVFLILAAFSIAGAAQTATNADQKIDPALEEIMDQGTDEAIAIIVMLKSDGLADDVVRDLKSSDLTVRYRYRLIPGLAGDASARAIREMAKKDQVSEIYLDGNTQVSAPDENSIDVNSRDDYVSHAQIIKADRLWEKGIDGRGVTVAVIDSGIDKNHPDLVGRVVAEKNFLSDEITADDLLGHGTMVAGIIAGSGAASNGKYKGIAPGADLINVKVIDSQGDGKVSDIIAGIEWAVYSGADVLSLSLGGINLGETNPPITMAADNAASAGAVVCVAAGNRNSSEASGQVASTSAQVSQQNDNDNVMLLVVPIVLALPPGLIDSPGDGVNVITVGAADSNGRMASFSGSGPTRDDRIKPDVVAPGVDIISTVPSGLKRPVYVDDYYARESGTSLSTPVAAGLSALLLQARENLTVAGVKAAMIRGATKLVSTQGDLYEEYYQGAGMLDALKSYELLSNSSNLCAAIPDVWRVGRWAYLPAGKGVYVGLDTGADRPQKKLYAMAPGDEDWNLRFVFFSNQDLDGVKTDVQGAVSDWVSIQALPKSIQANDQKVFSGSIDVPEDALPGSYNGEIEISDENESLLEIPISVNVAERLEISEGLGNKTGKLSGNGWDYYYLEMTPGIAEVQASIDWQEDANIDLFLLSPTSEYYAGEANGAEDGAGNASNDSKTIQDPASGRWMIAVHSENSSTEVEYNLLVERFMLETDPLRWNLESATVGSSSETQIALRNLGKSLDNLSYLGVIENSTVQNLDGSVLYKEVWEYPVNATSSTKKLSANLYSDDRTNTSELMLVFENPAGEPYDALLDTGDLGPLEISRPENGTWKVKVYGYEVPEDGQSFRILLKQYAENPWGWIETSGPRSLKSNESGVLEANLTLPSHTTQARQDGYIKISSDGQSFEIPVSVTVAGTRLEGLTSENVSDTDGDGLFDSLSLGFGINISANITAPEELRLKGTLADCNGSRILGLDRSISIETSGSVLVNVSGIDIWRQGKCGPMRVDNLILYDQDGTYIDRFEGEITVDRSPKDFQPPAALLTGEYVNLTTSSSIAIGVNVTVIKPGRYELQGTIVNDYNEELDGIRLQSDLAAGNTTMVLQFDPSLFMSIGEVSTVHLVDLVLLLDGEELERQDYAWATEQMDPQAFTAMRKPRATYSGPAVVKLGGAGGVQIENGTMVIS